METIKTNNGKKGGNLGGKPHSKGGVKTIIVDTNQPVEVELGEVIINKHAAKKHWRELSKINQSAGNGVPIEEPIFEGGGNFDSIDKKEIYNKWKELINMSYSDLKKFYDSEEGKEAGLTKSEAKKQGIHSGRESAEWIMKMKKTPMSEWALPMWRWAKRQISFVSRMSGMKGDLYDEKGNKTRKHTSLLIWGHNPEKFKNGGQLIKRADGHYSKHGLWDSIRENAGSGRKPTKEMLEQEAKLRKMKVGGNLITCKKCNWSWDKKDTKPNDAYVCHKCGYDNELKKGIKEEKEHIETAKKLYEHKIKPNQAAESIAKEHLKEDDKYYTKLEKSFKNSDVLSKKQKEKFGKVLREFYAKKLYSNNVLVTNKKQAIAIAYSEAKNI